MIDEKEMREKFESQHKERNLLRHRLRGTDSSPQIAALWNQHVYTALWVLGIYEGPEPETVIDTEREQFEVQMRKQYPLFPLERARRTAMNPDPPYLSVKTQHMYRGWLMGQMQKVS